MDSAGSIVEAVECADVHADFPGSVDHFAIDEMAVHLAEDEPSPSVVEELWVAVVLDVCSVHHCWHSDLHREFLYWPWAHHRPIFLNVVYLVQV